MVVMARQIPLTLGTEVARALRRSGRSGATFVTPRGPRLARRRRYLVDFVPGPRLCMAAMEITDLTHDERLAMVALLGLVVQSGRRIAEDAGVRLGRTAPGLGADGYDRLADEANRRFTDEDVLKAFLLSIDRQEARELIYGQVLDTAVENGVDTLEAELLDWLAKTWHVRVQVLDDPTGG